MPNESFSHLDAKDNPTMVNVSEKKTTVRNATAKAVVVLPDSVIKQFTQEDIQTKKGPVFRTAILAGIMGAKKTSDLIPLCHPLALENCKVEVQLNNANEVEVTCQASITGKTGVEMEALTGATVAALTIYDMCKAFSHDIVIKDVQLMAKSGGKRDFRRE